MQFHLSKENLRNVGGFHQFHTILPDGYEDSLCIQSFYIRDTKYKPNMVVVISYEDDLPLFGLITFIVLDI